MPNWTQFPQRTSTRPKADGGSGYGNGFAIQLDCPNDRYIDDEAVCQAAVGMLAQIGVTVNLDAKPKA